MTLKGRINMPKKVKDVVKLEDKKLDKPLFLYSDKIKYIKKLLLTHNLELYEVLTIKKESVPKILKEPLSLGRIDYAHLRKHVKGLAYRLLKNDKVELIPSKLSVQRKTEKVRVLNEFLETEKDINLGRVISISKRKMDNYLSGRKIPSKNILCRIAAYFFMDPKHLCNDQDELPATKDLVIDEELLHIQKNDLDNEITKFKNKNYLSRSFRVLGFKK